MFRKLYAMGICMSMGVVVLCASRTHTKAVKNYKRRLEVMKKENVSLEELFSHAQEATLKGNSREALRLYERICKDYKASDRAPDAYYSRGILYEANHQFSSAIKMFTKVVKCYPESAWFMAAIEHYFQVAKKLQDGVRPRYFGTIPGLRDYDSAVSNYELVVKYAPYSRCAPEALMEIANLHLRAKHPDLAINALDRLVDAYPDSVEVPTAYLKIAEIYSSLVKGDEYNQGGAVTALRYYKDFCLLFPMHEEINSVIQKIKNLEESIVRSKIALGDFYFNKRYSEKAAKIFYRLAIDYAPYTSAASTAMERIEAIDNGKRPESTPIDFLFPSYRPQNDDLISLDDKREATSFVQSEDILDVANEN